MKTNTILLIYILIISSSCASKLSVVSNNNIIVNQVNIVPEKQCILGNWNICCAENSKGYQTLYNVCPKVQFLPDGNGEIVFSGKNCFFQWAITEDNTIVFSFNSKKDEESFISKDTEFKLNFYNEKVLQYLELVQKENIYKYYLSRVRIDSPCSDESVIQSALQITP